MFNKKLTAMAVALALIIISINFVSAAEYEYDALGRFVKVKYSQGKKMIIHTMQAEISKMLPVLCLKIHIMLEHLKLDAAKIGGVVCNEKIYKDLLDIAFYLIFYILCLQYDMD